MAGVEPTEVPHDSTRAALMGTGTTPLPPGARVLTLEEVRDGVRLATGREHVLVVPAPQLVVEGPASVPTPPAGPTAIVSQRGAPKSLSPEPGPKTLWITHVGALSTPTMPDLVGFRARVTGVSPDPTPSLTFEWTLTLDYYTLAKDGWFDGVDHGVRKTKYINARVGFQVAYQATSKGGALASDAFRRAPGTVTKVMRPLGGRPDYATQTAGNGPLGMTPVAGGRLTIDVAATLPGVGRVAGRLEGYTVLAWDNPTSAAMRAYLATLALGAAQERGDVVDPKEASWVADVFCAETRMMQFSHANVTAYRRAFHPLSNNGGDGGVGLGQITHPESLTVQQAWDWRANAAAALAVYRGARAAGRAYAGAVRKALAELGEQSPIAAARALVAYRRAADLPPLAGVNVPDYTAEQLREDGARGYNGFKPGRDGRFPQFGKRFHEFRLRTEGSPARLYVENERIEGGARVADAVWVRVPDEERPPGPELKRYVEDHVLKPACP